MLEGLHINEKLFSIALDNKDFRIDSQFYTQEPILNPLLEYDKIGNLIHKAQYGISISMNEENVGYPIYRMNEIHNMLCDMNVSKSANITKSESETFTLNDRDVVFNRTNSFEWVGRTGLYRKLSNKDYVFASYLVRFIPNEKIILPEYLTSFLNSKYGVLDIKRRARQSINQSNVNPEEVKEIQIPKLSFEFQNKIKSAFDIANSKRIRSKQEFEEAKERLLKAISLEGFESKETDNYQEISLSKSFSTTTRLDAEYYHPKPLFLIDQLKIKNYYLVKDLFDISNGYAWKSKYFKEQGEGEPFVRIRNCKPGYIDNESLTTLDSEYAIREGVGKAKENDIVIGMDGIKYFYGSLINEPVYINQRVCHLSPKEDSEIDSELVLMIINSVIGQTQLMREMTIAQTVGHITNTSVGNLIIPKLDSKIRNDVSLKIKESHQLEKESLHLLEVSKRAVEIAIEENEETALVYIDSNTSNYAR